MPDVILGRLIVRMIDFEALVSEIRAMNTRKKLFKVLKTELLALGYWKNRPRGNPFRGHKCSFSRG